MTYQRSQPGDERIIALYNKGEKYTDIAEAEGLPYGTLCCRIAAMIARGEIKRRFRACLSPVVTGAMSFGEYLRHQRMKTIPNKKRGRRSVPFADR